MPVTFRLRSVTMLPLMLAMILVASMFSLTQPADAATRSQRVAKAFHVARAQLGDPYRYGSSGPKSFDCSGLVYYSFRRAGFAKVPRTSDAQARHARRIKRSKMRKGDLVFFHNRGNVYHVGVFAGNRNHRRTIIHASRSGTPVKRDPIWTNSWFAGTLR
ncbi:MAG TPA: C40 family peptidase [Nocardioidaceae bacterium]|nr:C40 family peptidase [Nocardioidaceae bacterium]